MYCDRKELYRMEYYAKSREKVLTLGEKERLSKLYENLMQGLESDLSEKERKALERALFNLLSNRVESQKLLKEHLDETVLCAEEFFHTYGEYFSEKEKKLIILACKIHDLGKVNLIFQQIVTNQEKNVEQIPHGFLSCIAIGRGWFKKKYPEMTEDDFDVLITAVYYHHTRTYDKGAECFEDYCEEYYKENLESYLNQPIKKLYYSNQEYVLFKAGIEMARKSEKSFETLWNEYLIVKGMLNKFDWTVSAGYQQAEIGCDISEKMLVKQINEQLKNGLRPAQEYMKNHTKDNLVIVAPTGSGKTEAALLWLDGEKGFYTLPLKVSSNAIFQRIKERYHYTDIALLHSDSLQKYLLEEKESEYSNYEKAKLFSYPLTICTVDQLFKFVYKSLGTEIFPATLKYSKLIIDEIQSYEPRIIAALIYGLKTIHKLGGKFAIITATFPPVLADFMEKNGLIKGVQYQYQNFTIDSTLKRHIISLQQRDFDFDEIIEMSKNKKVLVLCNTVSKAQKAYNELIKRKENNVFLLHSRYIRQHRNQLEEKIQEFSNDKEAVGIWVSTQIVEASLDIDFDILYTEMCTCDSLLQRMGRCNRAGRYEPKESNVIIFKNENGVGEKSVYSTEMYNRSFEFLEKYQGHIFTEEQKNKYISEVYDAEQIRDTNYYKKIEEYLNFFENIKPLDYDKKESDEKFRDINSLTVIPDSICIENEDVIEACIEFLKHSNIGKEGRAIIHSKLNLLTLNLNIYHKYPEHVDRSTINGTDIHRSRLKYEFDPYKCSGRGLLTEEERQECCIL